MLANDSSLSIRNPILIYSFLALYGLLTVLILDVRTFEVSHRHQNAEAVPGRMDQRRIKPRDSSGRRPGTTRKTQLPLPRPRYCPFL